MAPLDPGPGNHETVKVPLGQRHRGVKTNHGKQARDVQDGLNHLLAHGSIQIVELRGVVPGKAGAVVAVIDVARFAGGLVATPEDHGGIGLLVVVVFDLDLDAAVVREIGSVEGVGGIGRIPARDKPLRVLDDPGRVNAHVVGHHVAGQSYPMPIAAVAQVDVRGLAAEIVGDAIVKERVGRGDRILVATELLDGLRRAAALPHSNEPERIDAAVGEGRQFFVRNLIEPPDVPAMPAAELRQPHVGALGHEHRARHPRLVRRKFLVFVHRIAEGWHLGAAYK